jgi:hypothetical protein
MWSRTDLDKQLEKSFEGVNLHEGCAKNALYEVHNLDTEEKTASYLMYACIAIAVISGIIVLEKMPFMSESPINGTVYSALSLGSFIIGIIMTLAAKALIKIDYSFVRVVTGRVIAPSPADVIILRICAIIILLVPIFSPLA